MDIRTFSRVSLVLLILQSHRFKTGHPEKRSPIRGWDRTRRVFSPSSAASWPKEASPKLSHSVFSSVALRRGSTKGEVVSVLFHFCSVQRAVNVRGSVPQVLPRRARRCHLKHHSQLGECSEAVNCVEKSLFPFLLF